jgi:hypothetical protein
LFGDTAALNNAMRRTSCFCIQVKNSNQHSSAVDDAVNPESARICDVGGSWDEPVHWSKPFLAMVHLLQSDSGILSIPRTSKYQYGLVLKGFDESKQPCLRNNIGASMLDIVDAIVNPCCTAGATLGERVAAAISVPMEHKLGVYNDKRTICKFEDKFIYRSYY